MINDPLEQIRSIPGRMLMALAWHGISYLQAPAVLHHYGWPVNNLADLVHPDRVLEHLNNHRLYQFARTHTTSVDWLLLGQGSQVAPSHLIFNPGIFVQQALKLKQENELLGIYLLSVHHRMTPVQFTPVRPVLQLSHPALGPGFPVYELGPVLHWNIDEERLLIKGAFRALLQALGSSSTAPLGVMLDGSIAGLCFEGYLHPAQAILNYSVVEWSLLEALGSRPEPGEWRD
jgi:hypothetical protein